MPANKITVDWSALYHGTLTWVPANTIFLTRAGSHAYGLATPESDLDLCGVAIPTTEYFLGFTHRFEQAESADPDLVMYDIRKFFRLATACNPGVIEMLWTEAEDHLVVFPLGQRLLEHRSLFLSRKAKHTFSGYAVAQLKRIKTHRRWLTHPPTHKPTRAEFGLPEALVRSADILGAIEAVGREAVHGLSAFPAHAMDPYRWERAYRNALREWQQYEHWKAQRNPKRAALEARMDFDGKHAAHLVRLMRMYREILETGTVRVKRPDREELLAIRDGAWSYEQLVRWSEQEDHTLEAVAERSPLPPVPDSQKLDAPCIALVEEALGAAPLSPLARHEQQGSQFREGVRKAILLAETRRVCGCLFQKRFSKKSGRPWSMSRASICIGIRCTSPTAMGTWCWKARWKPSWPRSSPWNWRRRCPGSAA